MKRIPKTVITFLSGMLTAVPMVFPKLFIIGIVSFAMPAYIEYTAEGKSAKPLRTYGRGLSFFMGFGVVLFSWFAAMYPLEFTGLGKGAAVAVVCAGWIGLSLLQSLFWAIMFVVMQLAAKKLGVGKSPLLYVLMFSSVYVVFEWMSTKTWAAVPWGRLAVGQTGFLPMIQISSVFGGYAVSFILVFFGAALGVGIAQHRRLYDRAAFRPLALGAGILAVNILFGMISVLTYKVPEGSTKITAAAIQGNVSSHDKWTSESLEKTESVYFSLTEAAAGDGAQIAVFPESPIVYNMDGPSGDYVREYYDFVSETTGLTVVTGVFTKNADGISENSVMATFPDGGFSDVKYVKRHLVPFGEYVPLRGLVSIIFPPLSEIAMLSNDLASGDSPTLIDTEYGKIAPLICFDSIYETLAIDSIRAGGELITLSTNDSWFLDSAGVWEHNRHAVLRSVECGRYVVRAANTGVSSIIAPTGEILEILEPLVEGYITADVYMISENTVYTLIGNTFVVLCAAASVSIAVYSAVKKRERV